MKLYSIQYSEKGKNPIEFFCSEYSVKKIADFLKEHGYVVHIIEHKRLRAPKKELTNDEIEKTKYYNSKYSQYYRMYKKGTINKETFEKIKEILKVYKEVYKNKEILEKKFEEYKKTLTIIPQYNVSEIGK